MSEVQVNALQPASQQDIIMLSRLLRALLINLRVYPEGHQILKDVAVRLAAQLQAVHDAAGGTLLNAEESMLRVNRESIFKSCPEQEYSIMLASWLRERGVRNLLFGDGHEPEAILGLFAWLHRNELGVVRAQTATGSLPAELELGSIQINVKGGRSDEELREALDQMDLAPLIQRAGGGGGAADPQMVAEAVRRELRSAPIDLSHAKGQISASSIDWTGTDLSALVEQGQLGGVVDEANLSRFVDRYLEEQLTGKNAALAATDVDAIVDRLRTSLEPMALQGMEETLTQRASEAIAQMLPDAMASFLGDTSGAGPAGMRVRVGLLERLQDDEQKRAGVIDELAARLPTLTDPEEAAGAMAVVEELSSAAVKASQTAQVARAVGAITSLALSKNPAIVGRAEGSLRYIASPDTIRLLLHQLETDPADQRRHTGWLLSLLGRWSITTLLEVLRDSMNHDARLAIVDIITYAGHAAMKAGEDPGKLLSSVVRELDNYPDNPWYFSRNIVRVVANINTPSFHKLLLDLMGKDIDGRVLTEVARGLLKRPDPASHAIAREALLAGRLQDVVGLIEVVAYLIRADDGSLLDGLSILLQKKKLSVPQTEAVLYGLTVGVGLAAVPFLSMVLSAKSAVLRRPAYPQSARRAAVEVLGTVVGAEVQEALTRVAEDRGASARHRALELSQADPAESRKRLRKRLGLLG